MRFKMQTAQPTLDQLADFNNDGRVSLGELLLSALAFGIFLFVTLLALGAAAAFLLRDADFLGTYAVLAAVLATIAASVLGIIRVFRYEREERIQRTEIFRRRAAEDHLKQDFVSLSEDTGQPRITQTDIDRAAHLLLRAYYNGRSISREDIVGQGLLTKPLWDTANKALRERGIRKGRRKELAFDTYEEAWARYVQGKNPHKSKIVNGVWFDG